MDTNGLKGTVEILESLSKTIGLGVAAYWAYNRFIKQNQHSPRIDFEVDIRLVGKLENFWIAEIVAQIENKGLVPLKISEFIFDLRGFQAQDPIDEMDERISCNLKFAHIIKKGSWLPLEWDYAFIEPGLVHRYNHIATIPQEFRFTLLHGRFAYKHKESFFHTADKIVKIPFGTDADH